jgi:competence protein ComEA
VNLAELDRASRTNASAAPSAKTTRAARGTPTGSAAPSASDRVDLNRASAAELEQLPGIGPKLAERIIANRPFKSVEDLEAVPGIGPKTLEKLRPLVRVELPESAP